MRAGRAVVAVAVGMLALGAAVAHGDEDIEAVDTREVVREMVSDSGYQAGGVLTAAVPVVPRTSVRRHGEERRTPRDDGRPHQRLGTYPHWYRYFHRYGRDERHRTPPRSRHQAYRYVYPHGGYGFYLSFPSGSVGYWRDGRYYGYLPYGYGGNPTVVYVPYDRYAGDAGYGEYIILETPTAPEQGRAPETAVPQPARESGVPEEVPRFESRLSPMLSGGDRVGLAFALGEAALSGGRYAEAVTAFRQALRGAPGAPSVRMALAIALAAEGDYAGAAQMIRLGLGGVMDPGDLALAPVEVFGSAEALDEVVAKARAAAEQEPGADVQLVLGFVCFVSGRPEAAREALWAAYDAAGRAPSVGRLLLAAERRLRTQSQGAEQEGEEAAAAAEAAQP